MAVYSSMPPTGPLVGCEVSCVEMVDLLEVYVLGEKGVPRFPDQVDDGRGCRNHPHGCQIAGKKKLQDGKRS